VVRAPKVQEHAVEIGDPDKLAYSVCGILLSGACQQDRQLSVFDRAIEDHAGSDHVDRLLYIFSSLPERRAEMELYSGVHVHGSGGILYIQEMVVHCDINH